MSDLPACRDFIIPALRELRIKSNKLKKGTAGPTSIKKLFRVAGGLYSETEIHDALVALIKEGLVLVIASEREGDEYYGSDVNLGSFPEGAPFHEGLWYLDSKGAILIKEARSQEPPLGTSRTLRAMRAYVTADGLPKKFAYLGRARNQPSLLALRILASINKTPEKP